MWPQMPVSEHSAAAPNSAVQQFLDLSAHSLNPEAPHNMTAIFQASRAVNLAKIPDQSGKVYLVTGGNTGLGYEMVKALAAKNAHVFMTSRNSEKQKRWVLCNVP